MDLETKAREMATKAHEGQVRKYTGEPYINHPAAVVETLREINASETVLAAAWLHDVVEDTKLELRDVERICGCDVAELVMWLTDISRPSDGNRAKRKAIDRGHLERAPRDAQTIKLADLLDNTRSIAKHDPNFAKVYLREKNALLKVLKYGDYRLRKRAQTLLLVAAQRLEIDL